MKKVIKAELYIKKIDIDKFKIDCDRLNEEIDYCLPSCEYDTYEGEYNGEEVIGIDVVLANNTAREVNSNYSLFKKLFYDFTGEKPHQIIMYKLDRI